MSSAWKRLLGKRILLVALLTLLVFSLSGCNFSLESALEQLKAQGTIDEHTQILATHIGHKGGLLHEACDEALRSIWSGDIRTAYDGLQI